MAQQNDVSGYWPTGTLAFTSRNLRGLIDYGRKHGVARVDLGECISGAGLYTVKFSNGVECKGTFADPRVMLGFFLGRGFVAEVETDRVLFNKGTAMGRVTLPSHCDIGRNGSMRFGPWLATAYRDTHGTALVRFVRA